MLEAPVHICCEVYMNLVQLACQPVNAF